MQSLAFHPSAENRNLKTSVLMGFYLCVLLFRAYSHLLPFQLKNPPIVWVGNNLAGALYNYYGLYRWVVQSTTGALAFTCLLVASALAAALRPSSRLAAYLFSASFTLYAIVSSAHLGHNAHFLSMLVVLTLVFLPRKAVAFGLLWETMRYYICFVYVSALYFKILKGAAFQPSFGIRSFKANGAHYLLLNPETPRAYLYYLMLQHPFLLNLGAKIVFLMEGLFLIGFFTRKYDLFLLTLSVLIPVFTFLFADTLFFESLPASLVLLPERYWQKMAAALARRSRTRHRFQD